MRGAKEKTIRKVIRDKMTKWIDSIENEEVKEACKRDAFVTGGAIASMIIGEKINDYDVYFRTKETATAVAKYYVWKFEQLNPDALKPQVRLESLPNLAGETEERVVIWVQSAGAVAEGTNKEDYSYFEVTDNEHGDKADDYVNNLMGKSEEKDNPTKESKGKFRPVFLSQNAITLSDSIQLITRFYGEPEDIYKNYDFIHVQQHYDYAEDKVHFNLESMKALTSKTLIYCGSLYPVASFFRTKKFIARDWKISAGQMLKIAYQLRKVDWSNRQVIKDQLTGVDQAFMHQLIHHMDAELDRLALNEEIEQRGAKEIDDVYLAKLIDFIFEGVPIE